jgi:perosamine synthetase
LHKDRNLKVRLFRPLVGQEELDSIKETIDIQWLGLGEKVSEFEQLWSGFIGSPFNIAVNSATAALHLSLKAFNFPEGKKVLVPSLTFASTAMVVEYCKLIVEFVDVYEDTLTLDIEDLERKIDTDCVAVIPVHYGGQPVEMDRLMVLAGQHNLKVIEDCAHTQGGSYKGKRLGTWGDVGCFSFEEKKGMTTGDGGMISTGSSEIADKVKPMRWVGIDKDTWRRAKESNQNNAIANHWFYEIRDIGYKYNMNNLAASVGIAQLKKINLINESKNEAIDTYLRLLSGFDSIKTLLPYKTGEGLYYWLFGLRVEDRDGLIVHLNSKNIATGVHFTPLHMQPFWAKSYRARLPVTESIYNDIITLPLFPGLTTTEIEYVVCCIKSYSTNGK